MTTLSPAAQQALTALAPFRPRGAKQVKALLSTWARRHQLTPEDFAAVVAAFPARRRGGAR